MTTQHKWTRRLAVFAITAAILGSGGTLRADAAAPSTPAPAPAAPAAPPATQPKFEKDILAYEAADRQNPPKPGGIVFYGSSSIRMWKSLTEDFPELNVLNRGFGGSTAPEALYYLDRMVLPYKPSAVVIYEGDNDLNKGRTPEEFLADCKTLAARIHEKLPKTRVLFLAIKPSLKRAEQMPEQTRANKMVQEWTKSDPRLGYIDVVTPMMGEDGKPRPELFIKDGLHMTPAGYEVWVKAIKPHLEKSAEEARK